MKRDHIKYLMCPACKGPLELHSDADAEITSVKSGSLHCGQCQMSYPIIGYIPRFVPLENYAASFGLEWKKHAKTQYDSHSGSNASEKRFFEETTWPRDLTGQIILEVGSGSGRFTEQAISTGAMICSLDYSRAVEANYASNGHRDNVLIVQGDIYKMPFREDSFDKVFCFGVLQHTPDVGKAFSILPRYLRSGGQIAIDVYRKLHWRKQLLNTKCWVRPISKRLNPEWLYRITSSYVRSMWPLARFMHKFPYGKKINWTLLIADYRDELDVEEDMLTEWAILDTFDMLSPAYDQPQSMETVKQWFRSAQLTNVDIRYGYNGIEARAIKP